MVQAQERAVAEKVSDWSIVIEPLEEGEHRSADYCIVCGQRFCYNCGNCNTNRDGLCCTCRYQEAKDSLRRDK